MKAVRIALVFLALIVAGRGVLAAPMFPDVPDMWAADAVRALASKGILEGYPDGTFKGDRAATRYETAMVVARLLAKMEQEHATFATRADLEDLNKLVRAYMSELDTYGIHIQALEDHVSSLERRVNELERITFYGEFRSIGIWQHTAGAALIGTLANPAVDFTNGRLIFDGVGATARSMLGAHIKLNQDMDAGLELISYVGTGETLVEQYWGVTPPFNSNPFLSLSSAFGGTVPQNNRPFNRMALDRFWFQDHPADVQLVIGSYHMHEIGDQVAIGIRNPNVNGPLLLPFWGMDLTRIDRSDKIQYEFAYSFLPAITYQGWLGAGAANWDYGRGHLGVSLMRLANDAITDGQPLPSGLVGLPAANGVQLMWRDKRTGNLTSVVGPQDQDTVGVNADFDIIPNHLTLHGNWAHSRYNPDKSKTILDSVVGGNVYSAGLSGRSGQFFADVEYIHVDPTYDTVMLPYPTNPLLPVFLPYGNWYSSHYQLHDYFRYPDNREGPRVRFNWDNGHTSAYATFEDFRQVKATTIAQITTPGNVEPLFSPMVVPGDLSRGTATLLGIGVQHKFDFGLRLGASYYDYRLHRGAAPIDDIDTVQDFYRVQAGYPLADRVSVNADYTLVTLHGHNGLLNRNFDESVPGLSFDWTPEKNMSVTLGGRLLTFHNKAAAFTDWHGNQLTVDFNVDI